MGPSLVAGSTGFYIHICGDYRCGSRSVPLESALGTSHWQQTAHSIRILTLTLQVTERERYGAGSFLREAITLDQELFGICKG